SLTVDYNDLVLIDDTHELDLASTLMENPYFMLATGSEALGLHVKSENLEFYREVILERDHYYLRFHETPSVIKIRDIRSSHVDSLKWMDGIVIRTTEIRSIITRAFYVCNEGHELEVTFTDGIYFKPDRCINDTCKSKEFALDQHRSKLIDWQYVTVQEKPEDLPPGASPKSIVCRLTDDIVNAVRPGDRVVMGGIVRTKPHKQIKKGQVLTFDTWIDINHLESLTKDDEFLNITPEEEKLFIDISNDPKIHERIISSIAPAIYGYDEIKEAAMLLLFSGVTKTFPDGFTTRGQPNILLVGDPGVAKSQMLRYVQSIAPRGIFTSGKGSSAAGLTAAIVRDPDTGEVTLEAGALVLADRGICLAGNTEILSANGELLTIESIVESKEKFDVKSFSDETFEVHNNSIIATSKRYSEDVYEILLSTAEKITITKEHPLPTWDNGVVWKTVDDIEENDVIIDFRNYHLKNSSNYMYEDISINEEFAEILGLILTDGSLSKNKYNVIFYSKSDHLLQRYRDLALRVFNIEPNEFVDKRNGVTKLYFGNKSIHSMLIDLGIPNENKSKSKCIIPSILHAPPNIIQSFISGVINGDGSVSNRKGGGIIDIVVGNLETAHFYRKILRKIGCIARVHEVEQKGGGVVPIGSYQSFKVSITGISNIKKIKNSKLLSYKKENHEKILSRRNNSGRLYKIDILINKISSQLVHTQKSILYGNNVKLSQLKTMGVNRKNIIQSLNDLSDITSITILPEYKLLKKIIEQDIHFSKVISKQKAEPQMVYNIEIEGDQTYFANFIPVHNCLIDEFDKMNENDRSAIHEAMEQHQVSIAKAGIVATLNARTGVMAAANPKYGRYEPNRTFNENVNLSAPILSRFDLVFILRDEPEEDNDSVIASHILNLHRYHGNTDILKPPLTVDELKKYIAYAKKNYHPVLSEEASELIENFYVSMRSTYGKSSNGTKQGDRVTITARQLEGIIRLSEA
ncbi:MAG: hypothetical protein GPJ54_19055, partial [Candidatus Heimdallarchaeota archaeon]|nr:hypothetical protein [Candidatus Heimdallarchaeota archaeon]